MSSVDESRQGSCFLDGIRSLRPEKEGFMKKKQLLSIVLTALMVTGAVAGCGSSSSSGSNTASSSSTTAATEAAPAAETSAAAATDSAEAATETSSTANTDISGELNLIHYLTEDNKIAALDELVSGFESEYPNVTVNTEAMSMDNYTDVIKLRFSTNEAPDIIFGQPKSNTDLIDNGLIMDLSGEDFTSRLSESSKACVTYNDGVYGIPLDQMANVVFYNKDIFEKEGIEIPTTYDEFISVCKKLSDDGIVPCAAGYTDDIAIGANFYTIYYGAKWAQAENNAQELMDGASFSDYPGYSEALDEWREIMKYQNTDCKSIDTARAEQMFANGDTAMIIIGTWGLGSILGYNPDGNFGGFMYPSENTADENAVPVNIDDCWMISQDTQNKDAALAFLEYATRPDVNAKWCGTASQLSALDGVECDSLPAPAQDIANEIATKKTTAWASVSNFSGQYNTAYYATLHDFVNDDSMTAADWCNEIDQEFASARK